MDLGWHYVFKILAGWIFLYAQTIFGGGGDIPPLGFCRVLLKWVKARGLEC